MCVGVCAAVTFNESHTITCIELQITFNTQNSKEFCTNEVMGNMPFCFRRVNLYLPINQAMALKHNKQQSELYLLRQRCSLSLYGVCGMIVKDDGFVKINNFFFFKTPAVQLHAEEKLKLFKSPSGLIIKTWPQHNA